MKFARRMFAGAGIYGLLSLLPMYFLEQRIGRDDPPAVTHPEFFYGFVGVATAWQIAFLIIAGDPVRFRPLMPAAIVEKATFGVAALVLFEQGRLSGMMTAAGVLDLLLGLGFATAYVLTGREQA